ncbi:deazaflavin-dependent oxidoreductase, nitroreductase family [Amycolatopsis arida]|uniref:Deazaflavin-dependent oxidoreductase, nitroreductase family n=1 Tax=Amycolatopsis arida TaxID=587909 RepID=A0A1I6A6J7_9PSEU|nr:nitroreductase/quinone reductase family protein [Amycolatopsis arida]TDX88578.1 deazaflavin-dependent oxidoreductase (nitroreductase family) [Amycolatopsis arida]SFQ64265.1 deazaflavin-dependent oxidoreductase, nitroreductase family [Amycolatopsis arida]
MDFNQQIIDEFRANRGQVGGPFANARLLLLTTTGARSGKPHTVPLGYLLDEGERLLVIASAAGAPQHPAWYHNIRANPRVTVETGPFTVEADAVVLEGEERDRIFARAVEADPGWGEYQARTERVIPVVALNPVGGAPNGSSPGEGLKLIHDAFRRELALIRTEVATSGPGLGAQLRINCLTLCEGLHYHHTMEDGHLFPALDESYPELAEPLARLRREHEKVKTLLDQLRELISSTTADRATVLAGVERLTAEVEAHLDYEEANLIPVMDAMVVS